MDEYTVELCASSCAEGPDESSERGENHCNSGSELHSADDVSVWVRKYGVRAPIIPMTRILDTDAYELSEILKQLVIEVNIR
jgi:hypothetical protein